MSPLPSSLMSANTDDGSNWIKGWSVDPLEGPHGELVQAARAEETARRLADRLDREGGVR